MHTNDKKFNIIDGGRHDGFERCRKVLDDGVKNGTVTGIGIAIIYKDGTCFLKTTTENGNGVYPLLGCVSAMEFEINKWLEDHS